MTVHVAVVVPTYQRPDLLAHCLQALLGQKFDPQSYEIIVVDDAATCATKAQVACWAQRALQQCHGQAGGGPQVRYVPVTATHGPAAARNAGWRATTAPIIAFTDDDCLPEPGWLRAGLAAFTPDVAGVAGRIVMPQPIPPTDYEQNAAGLARSEFVTANCFYRRTALAEVGGFDERFTAAWREDTDLHFQLLRRNYRLVQAVDAVVIHPIRPAAWGVSVGQQRKSMFNALLYRKHPALYRERVQAAPPWHYYRIVAALLTALWAQNRGRSTVAGAAWAVWLWLTGRFCLQRLKHTSHAPAHIAEMIVTSALLPPLSIFWRLWGAWKYRVWFW